jgi:hypothetical protein
MVPIVQPKPGRFVVTLAQTKVEKIGQSPHIGLSTNLPASVIAPHLKTPAGSVLEGTPSKV